MTARKGLKILTFLTLLLFSLSMTVYTPIGLTHPHDDAPSSDESDSSSGDSSSGDSSSGDSSSGDSSSGDSSSGDSSSGDSSSGDSSSSSSTSKPKKKKGHKLTPSLTGSTGGGYDIFQTPPEDPLNPTQSGTCGSGNCLTAALLYENLDSGFCIGLSYSTLMPRSLPSTPTGTSFVPRRQHSIKVSVTFVWGADE